MNMQCPTCGEIVWDDDSYDRYFVIQDALVIKARNKAKKREALFGTDSNEVTAEMIS
jgi:hypothetical protein